MSKLAFNPEMALIDSVACEEPLPSNRLSLDWLRHRFSHPPKWQPEYFDEYCFLAPATSFIHAAVLIPIIVNKQGLTLLLTQRAACLNKHAGQISFPGGRVSPVDSSIIETALRETEEEVGLHRSNIEVLGILPDYFTATGFCVTPVVAIVHSPFKLCPAPFEVEEIFEVPFTFLMNGTNYERRVAKFLDGNDRRTFYAIPYGRFFIWGATAGILRNLFHFLRA